MDMAATATAVSAMPIHTAAAALIRWDGTGRTRVRRITVSMSASRPWLMAFAPAAASVPATMTTSSAVTSRPPALAFQTPAAPVTTSREMTRGLESAMTCRVRASISRANP